MDFEASSKVHDQANDEEDDTAPIIDLLGLFYWSDSSIRMVAPCDDVCHKKLNVLIQNTSVTYDKYFSKSL